MQVLKESDVEYNVSIYADSKGCLVVKLNIIGRRGWPDRFFLFKGKVFFIEFKKQGEKSTKLQEYVHGKIRQHGARVFVVDNIADGRALIDSLTQES